MLFRKSLFPFHRLGVSILAMALISYLAGVAAAQLDDLGLDDLGSVPSDAGPEVPADDTTGAVAGVPAEGEEQMTAEEFWNETMQMVEDGKCAEAIERLSQFVAVRQDYLPAHIELGKCYLKLKEYDLAIQSLSDAVVYGPTYPDGFVERGKIHLQLGQYQLAASDFRAAVSMRPANAEYLFLRGKAKNREVQTLRGATAGQEAGQFLQEALTSLDRAIDIRDDYAEAYAERAGTNSNLGNLDEALADMQKAVELDPEKLEYNARLGFLYLRRADIEDNSPDPDADAVLADYQAGISAMDKYLADALAEDPSSDLGDAIDEPVEDEMDKLEEVKPEQVLLGRASARVALANKMPAEARDALYRAAIDDCNLTLQRDETLSSAIYQRGIAERLAGDLQAASDSLTKAIQMAGDSPEIRLRRGIVSYYQGEYDLALQDFEKAVADSFDGRANFWAGVVHAKQGNYAEAIRMYNETLRANPGYKPAYNNRALAYMHIGSYRRAMRDYNELLLRDRDNTLARRRRDQAKRLAEQQQNR